MVLCCALHNDWAHSGYVTSDRMLLPSPSSLRFAQCPQTLLPASQTQLDPALDFLLLCASSSSSPSSWSLVLSSYLHFSST